MPTVKMELLQANGRLRKAKAYTETQWPNFLVNHHDRHAYSLNERPVSYDVKPVRFYDWDSLIAAEPPLPPHMPDKLLSICEDGAIWPVSNEMQPDLNDRQMLFKEFFDDGAQSANAQATKDAQGSSVITAASIICMMVFAAASLILVIILLQSEFGDSFKNFASIPGIFSGIIPAQIVSLAGLGGTILGGNLGLFLASLGVVATEATFKRRAFWGKLGFKRHSGTPRVLKQPKEKKPRPPKMIQGETLRLFDELAGFFWSAELPMSVLIANLSTDCRYSEEPKIYRYMGAAIFGLGVMVLIRIPLIFMGMGSMTGLVLALVLGLPFGALIGYMKGYKLFQPAPRWIARRVYVRDEDGKIDYEALPIIIPEAHTLLAGISPEEAYNTRREVALSALAQFQESRRQAATPGANGNGNGPEPEEQNVQSMAMAYSPRVLRANTLYQILKCVDLREKLKGPEGKGAKVQQIVMAGMAIGSIGLLVFAIVVTQ